MTLLHQAAQKAVEALKPCPFCGSPDIGWWGDVPYCGRCDAMGPTEGQDDTRENMARAWNRRAESALQQQPEPVAVVGGDWTLLWVGSAPIAHIVERHPGLKVGSLLYTAPPALQQQEVPAAVRDAHGNIVLHNGREVCYRDEAPPTASQEVPREPVADKIILLVEEYGQLRESVGGSAAVFARSAARAEREQAEEMLSELRALLAASPSTTRQQEVGSGLAHVHESCWLIEATAPPRPLYYAGPKRGGRRSRTLSEVTEDAGRAIRFPTEDAAKLTIALICGIYTDDPTWPLRLMNSGWKATEHIFDYTPLAAAPSTTEKAGGVPHPDTVLLDFIASEYLDVSAFAMPTGGDDADVGWKLHQEHMGAKGRVEVVCHYRDDLRAAIREAMQALGYSVPAGVPSAQPNDGGEQ